MYSLTVMNTVAGACSVESKLVSNGYAKECNTTEVSPRHREKSLKESLDQEE